MDHMTEPGRSSAHQNWPLWPTLWLLLLFIIPLSSFANEGFSPDQALGDLKKLSQQLDEYESKLAEDGLDDAAFLELRKFVRELRDPLSSITESTQPLYEAAQAEVENLGPVPEGENAQPEPDNIIALRKELTEKQLQLEGLIKQTESLSFRTTRVLKDIASKRRDLFVGHLIHKQDSPLNQDMWANALGAYQTQLSMLLKPSRKGKSTLLPSLITSGLLFLILLSGSALASSVRLKRQLAACDDTTSNRVSAIAHSLLLPMLVSIVGLLIVYQVLHTQNLVTDDSRAFIYKCLGLTLLVSMMYLVSKRLANAGLFRPSMRWMGFAAALLYALDAAFLESGRMMGAPVDLAVGQSYIVTTLFAALLAIYTLQALKLSGNQQQYFIPRQFCYLAGFLSALILIANVFGYPALSRFILVRVVLLFTLFVGVMMLRYLARPWIEKLDQMMHQDTTVEEGEETPKHLLFFWLSLTFDLLLLLAALPLVAGIIGADWNDIRDWAIQALLGFQVGNITISFSNIALAISFFIALLFVTRLLQKVLGQNILPKTRLDESLRQSIIQVLGYVGLILALLVAISALGFDLTNLALIAGALSVGIGFGLQSIVSNFVSGLILLFERPIKVGDWIITNSGEGFVKRISVRSTEIETFDRTSIIVPNSELITSSVKNWTHKDRIGRVVIPVGVSYSDDPHQVMDLLMQTIKAHSNCLKHPEPSVVFKDFGDSALIFETRFFIRNITDLPRVSTQVRLDIWDVLKEAGVEISFPQRDLHIRTAPGLKGLLYERPSE